MNRKEIKSTLDSLETESQVLKWLANYPFQDALPTVVVGGYSSSVHYTDDTDDLWHITLTQVYGQGALGGLDALGVKWDLA